MIIAYPNTIINTVTEDQWFFVLTNVAFPAHIILIFGLIVISSLDD